MLFLCSFRVNWDFLILFRVFLVSVRLSVGGFAWFFRFFLQSVFACLLILISCFGIQYLFPAISRYVSI